MPYEDYTLPENIRPKTRKRRLRKEYEKRGEAAMRRLNKTFKPPIKDSSMATWLCHWRHLEA